VLRIIVDSQSNRLFKGIRIEQNYDQKGVLCQVGKDHLVITTEPINNEYLKYWKDLGFSLPNLITSGHFNLTAPFQSL